MAIADKTYVTKEEYILVKKWWLKTRKKQVRELGNEIWMYPFSYLSEGKVIDGEYVTDFEYDPSESDLDIETFGEGEETLWNTSTRTNFWLAKNCPFEFIQTQIKEKLSTNFYMKIPEKHQSLSIIDRLDFSVRDRILYITNKDVELFFFSEPNEFGDVEYFDKMVSYGTPFVFKVIDEAKQGIRKYSKKYEIGFLYCGIEFILKNGKLNVSGGPKNIQIPFFNGVGLLTPKIKYSFNRKDADKLSICQVILSEEDKIHTLDAYVEPNLKRYIFSNMPDYLKELII